MPLHPTTGLGVDIVTRGAGQALGLRVSCFSDAHEPILWVSTFSTEDPIWSTSLILMIFLRARELVFLQPRRTEMKSHPRSHRNREGPGSGQRGSKVFGIQTCLLPHKITREQN